MLANFLTALLIMLPVCLLMWRVITDAISHTERRDALLREHEQYAVELRRLSEEESERRRAATRSVPLGLESARAYLQEGRESKPPEQKAAPTLWDHLNED